MTAQTNTNTLLRGASKALEGKHPLHDFPINDGTQHVTAHALVALATEQQTTNQHLAAIADSLVRIATALEDTTTPALTPTRRVWRRGRRR